MIQGRDFIITGLQSWDMKIGSNAKDIAKEISKSNRVLYVNPHWETAVEHGLRQISESLWVLDIPTKYYHINFLPDGKLYDFLNRMNEKKRCKHIFKVIEELNFSDYFLFIDNDIINSYFIKELIKPYFSIYYRRDFMDSPYWNRHAGRLEKGIAAKCDCVMSNSSELGNQMKDSNPNVFYVGQGVDLSGYKKEKFATLDNVEKIKRPIVGYVGNLVSHRLDIGLIADLARANKNVSFVLVGPEDDQFKDSELHKLENVYFLGSVDMNEVPDYINSFDICYNPQLLNKTTIGNYPRKVDEYLSLGKPVLATATATMRNIFADSAYLADGIVEYKEKLWQALHELRFRDPKLEERRKELAFSHTWTDSVGKIYEGIETVISKREAAK